MVKSGTKVQHVLVELPMYMRHEVIQSHSVLLTIVAVLTCDPSIEVFPADPDGTMADTHDRHIPNQRRRAAASAARSPSSPQPPCTLSSAWSCHCSEATNGYRAASKAPLSDHRRRPPAASRGVAEMNRRFASPGRGWFVS